jgi:hypothetical protein
MFCNKCGNNIPEDSIFCQKCGANQTPVTSTPSHASQQPQVQIPALMQQAKTQITRQMTSSQQNKPIYMRSWVWILAAAVIIIIIFASCTSGSRDSSLVGRWEGDFVSFELRSNGRYTWMGTDYGAMGYRWSSRNGVISFSLEGVTVLEYRYEFIDNNTLRITYLGITYTLRRV